MNRRDSMAAYVTAKRMPRSTLPANGVCQTSNLPYWNCRCDKHRCGTCGRRRSQHGEPNVDCPCERNRRQNGFPPHWRTGLLPAA